MTTGILDIIFLVDTSTKDNGTISSIHQNIGEIVEELRSYTHRISLVSFNNIPCILENRNADYHDIKIPSNPSDLGGMCNVHFALRSITDLLDESDNKITCIILFLTSDPTDSDRLLDERVRDSLSISEKHLIKKSSTLLEPRGFDGNHAYLIGNEKDLKRLIINIKDACEKYDSTESDSKSTANLQSTVIEKAAHNQNDSFERTESEQNEDGYEKNASDNDVIDFVDEELPSPDIYK